MFTDEKQKVNNGYRYNIKGRSKNDPSVATTDDEKSSWQ